MSPIPSYVLLGAAIVVFFVFFLRRPSLFVRLAGVFVLIALAGWAVGLWRLPPGVEQFLAGVSQPFRGARNTLLAWIVSLFP